MVDRPFFLCFAVKLEAPRFVSHEVISDMITVMWNNMDTEKSSDININCRLRYREEGVRNWTEVSVCCYCVCACVVLC